MKKFYVTTPIYYVTAKPHLGSLYSTLLADVAARWHRLKGIKSFFMTGTDEHGQKVAEAATKAGMQPQAFVDSHIESFKDMWHKYGIMYDHFGRTTDESHVKAVQHILQKLIESGDVHKGSYEGYYCVPCETYVTEPIQGEQFAETPLCLTCNRQTKFISEESYFFRLSRYQDRLLQFYKDHPDFVQPAERLHEVISFVESGLKDLSISRTTVSWGIPFPGDPKHTVYVWADALMIYASSVGYGNGARKEEFDLWWPANMQVMGKDIVRFHAVIWPAMLMAAELPLPERLLVHGWLKVNNQKMSKSFGNVIDPQTLLDAYGADPVRYYLARHMAITHDAEFSTLDLEQRITSDLANDLGNLLNRMITLAHKHELYEIAHPTTWGVKEVALRDAFWTMLENYSSDMEDGFYHRALQTLWKFINDTNSYFHEAEPWKVTDKERFKEILSATCHSLYGIGVLLLPVMPTKMYELLKSLGVAQPALSHGGDAVQELADNPWVRTFLLHQTAPLFQKFEPQKAEAGAPATQKGGADNASSGTAAQQAPASAAAPASGTITIDDVIKVELIACTIEAAEEVPGSDKLIKMQINAGPLGMRQVLAGIKKSYTPADLMGKQAIFVGNLAPRKMMGNESQGMLLVAEGEDGKVYFVSPQKPVPNGTRLR